MLVVFAVKFLSFVWWFQIYFHFNKSDCVSHSVVCLSLQSPFMHILFASFSSFLFRTHLSSNAEAHKTGMNEKLLCKLCLLFYRWNANEFMHGKTVSRHRRHRWWCWWHCYFIVLYFFVEQGEHNSFSCVSKILHLNECAFVELIPAYKPNSTLVVCIVCILNRRSDMARTLHSQSTVFTAIISGIEWCKIYVCEYAERLRRMMCVCSSSKFCQASRWNYIIRYKNVKRMK